MTYNPKKNRGIIDSVTWVSITGIDLNIKEI